MGTHTPGPWVASEKNELGATVRAEGIDVAYVPLFSSTDWHHRTTLETRYADADLIAAAPELLEACQEALRHCLCTFAQRMSGHLVDCFAPQLEAAIAKAEGNP